MLTELASVPDLFCHFLEYLPLFSISRLRRTSQLLRTSIHDYQRRINSSHKVKFDLNFEYLGFRLELIPIKNGYLDHDPTFNIQISRAPSVLAELVWQTVNGAGLYKSQDGTLRFCVGRQGPSADVLHAFFEHFIAGFRFEAVTVHLSADPQENQILPLLEQFAHLLVADGCTRIMLSFYDSVLSQEAVESLCTIYQPDHLSISTDQRPPWEMTADFLRSFPNLRRIGVLHCDIGDADLQRLDYVNFNSPSRITLDGVFTWIRRKIDDASIDDGLDVQLTAEDQDIVQQRIEESFKCFDDGRNLNVRAQGHLWLSIRNPIEDGISIFVQNSNAECFMRPMALFPEEEAIIRLTPKFPGFTESRLELISLNCYFEKEIYAEIYNVALTCEAVEEGRLLENWDDGIDFYEVGFRAFVIYINEAVFNEAGISRALTIFGLRLRRFGLRGIRCESTPLDASLDVLCQLLPGLSYVTSIQKFFLRGMGSLSEVALLKAVRALGVHHLEYEKPAAQQNVKNPLRLSANFFNQTPTLTSLKVKASRAFIKEHHLGINDATLERFEHVKAKSCETEMSPLGVAAWVKNRRNDENPKTPQEIEIALRVADKKAFVSQVVVDVSEGRVDVQRLNQLMENDGPGCCFEHPSTSKHIVISVRIEEDLLKVGCYSQLIDGLNVIGH